VTAAHTVPSALREPDPPVFRSNAALDADDAKRIDDAKTAAHPTIVEYHHARFLAKKLYPAPFAALIGEELEGWCDLGHRFGTSARVSAVYAQVMSDAREAGLA
jgi:hypothetical protein